MFRYSVYNDDSDILYASSMGLLVIISMCMYLYCIFVVLYKECNIQRKHTTYHDYMRQPIMTLSIETYVLIQPLE